MSTSTSEGVLTSVYRERIGDPTTHDEVRGYWVFLVGLVLGTAGIALFLPSTTPTDPAGLSLREASIFVSAVGLAMLVAGAVIRLPLRSWANYAAYVGQAVCFAAAVWFVSLFPGQWNVQTGNEPVIVLYVAGLATITLGGAVVPLVVGTGREAPADAGPEATGAEQERDGLRAERDRLEDDLAAARSDADTAEAERTDLEATLDGLYESRARFELYEDSAGDWRWRLRHRNGNIVADSGQGYTRKQSAQTGMASVRRNALGAATLVFESETEVPDEDEPFEPAEAQASQATFEVEADSAGEYRWRLRHENGNVVADGGEGYASSGNATRAVDRVRELAPEADYLWFDPAGFEVYEDAAGEWRWRLVHRNGNVLADGGEGYTRRNDATRAVERVRERGGPDGDLEYEVYEDAAGEYRWRLLAGNGEILGDSGEGYGSRSAAEDAVERVQGYAPDADVLDVGRAAFEIYEDSAGEHRWRLRHQNGNIVADSGQGYDSRSAARDGIESVKRNAPSADLDEQ